MTSECDGQRAKEKQLRGPGYTERGKPTGGRDMVCKTAFKSILDKNMYLTDAVPE